MRDTPEQGQGQSIEAIGAELAKRRAEAVADGGRSGMEAEDRMWGAVRDLEHLLARERPGNAREAVIVAALASHMVREVDDVAGVPHQLACSLVARLLDWLEAEAAVTAAELGLGSYAAGRDDGPHYKKDDGTETLQLGYDCGYLAAVRRFAPTSYPFVRRMMENNRAGGRGSGGFDLAAHERASAAGAQHDAEPVGFATEVRS